MSVPVAVAATIIKELITAGSNLMVCKEQEKTKRAQIEAELEAKLTAINKDFALYSMIFANNHAETMKVYNTFETVVNQPETRQNPALVQQLMTALANLHANAITGTSNNIAALKER